MLAKRLLFLPLEQRNSIVNFVELYNIEQKIDDFVADGICATDISGRTVSVIHGTIREGVVHLPIKPYTDITVVAVDDAMFIGWIRSDKIKDADDRFILNVKSLSPMPREFDFAQTCAHMSEWGGWFVDGNWECAGCGQQVILN